MTLSCNFEKKGCGGCANLAQPYLDQLVQKQNKLKKLIGEYVSPAPIIGMENPLFYRYKVLRTFTAGAHGRLEIGLYAEESHKVIPCENCLLEDKSAALAAYGILEAARACRYQAFNEDRGTGLLRHVVLRRSLANGQLMATVVAVCETLPSSRAFCAEVKKRVPALATLALNTNTRTSSAVFGARTRILFGDGYLEDALCGCRFSISPLSFYQVNPVQAQQLYACAMEYAELSSGTSVVDAYCGTGTIGLIAAKHGAGSVVGVETNASAVKDAIQNAHRNSCSTARFLCADAGIWMQQAAASDSPPPDVLFLDPPRAGASRAFLQSLCTWMPKRVVYISCNPETLARDMAYLTQHGYRAMRCCGVDMFPFTEHVEAIILMTYCGDKTKNES